MKNPSDTVRGYVTDMMGAHRHVLEAVTRHAEDPSLAKVPGAQATIARIVSVLDSQHRLLEARAQQLGGAGAMGGIKEAVTSVTGFLTGLYGQVRGETASRMLRDDYTGLNFLLVCATMLHTTSTALGDAETTSVCSTIVRGLPPLLMDLQELVPRAVVRDLAEDHPGLDTIADAKTIPEVKAAWRGASHAGA
jgi:hypothetical protein